MTINFRTIRLVLIAGIVFWATRGPVAPASEDATTTVTSSLDQKLEALDDTAPRRRRSNRQ